MASHTSSYSTYFVVEAAANCGASDASAALSASSRGRPAIVEHIDEDRVEEAAIRGVIGARPASVAREQHMQRADAEISRAGLARLFACDRERGKVADPLVATALVRAAQGVELSGGAEALT